jgi:hypothetical protein
MQIGPAVSHRAIKRHRLLSKSFAAKISTAKISAAKISAAKCRADRPQGP